MGFTAPSGWNIWKMRFEKQSEGESDMKYYSTRDAAVRMDAAEAIKMGLSRDGGLLTPTRIPQIDRAFLERLIPMEYAQRAAKVMALYLTDYSEEELLTFGRNAYGPAQFDDPAAAPVRKVEDGLYCLEPWHGPTSAFKDMALQMLPQLLSAALRKTGEKRTACILAATSGDTGKAALAGYAGLPGIEIEVFYPNAGTSEIQRLQMATQAGDNVSVYAVNGNFDDAQTGVKRVFGDASVAEELEKRNICLSSANSINWGRLVPQIVYYFYAYFRLVEQGNVAWGQPVDFCVPTGNFGDILAGYYAKQMGLPVGKLVCASNKNNVLTDFIKTGTYDARRTFYKTTSPSMDILISSNLERLLYHVSGSSAKVAGWMADLAKTGMYTVDAETLACIQASFACGCADDTAGAAEINARFEQDNYLCDTHTAVAFCVAETVRSAAPMVVLSTASPYKFPRDVLAALGETAPESDFAAMAALNVKTGCPVPASLSVLNTLPVRFNTVIEPAAIRDAALK